MAIGLAAFKYARTGPILPCGDDLPDSARGLFPALHKAASHRFYIDEIYQFITHKIIFACISRPIAWIDRHIVDGFFNALGWTALITGEEIRPMQSGHIQQYAIWFLGGALAITVLLLLI